MAAVTDTPAPRPAGDVTSGKGLAQYLRDVRTELKKAEWPTRAELTRLTQVVLVIIAVVAAYCGALDSGLGYVLRPLFTH